MDPSLAAEEETDLSYQRREDGQALEGADDSQLFVTSRLTDNPPEFALAKCAQLSRTVSEPASLVPQAYS